MVSILEKIKEYADNEDKSFRAKRIKYNLFPWFYNRAIEYAISSVMKNAGVAVGSDSYVIALDQDNNVRIEIGEHENDFFPLEEYDPTHDTLFIIKDGEGYYDEENNNLYIPESLIYKAASYLRKNQAKLWKIRKAIEDKGEGLTKSEKLYKEYTCMSEYMNKDIPRDEENGVDYLNDKILDGEIEDSIEKIINKIRNARKWLASELSQYDVFPYKSTEGTTNRKKTGLASGNTRYETTAIPLEDRFNYLKSKKPREIFKLSDGGQEVTDYVAFYVKNGRNIMIIEPFNGRKGTRVIFLENEELQYKSLPEIATNYAAMPMDSFIKLPNALRLYHTTFESFKARSSFLIEGEGKNIKNYFRNKVASINGNLSQEKNKVPTK